MIGVYSAMIGFAFATIRPGWFGWWYWILLRIEASGSVGEFIAKPLGACPGCTAGMYALLWSIYSAPMDIPMHIAHAATATTLGCLIHILWTGHLNR